MVFPGKKIACSQYFVGGVCMCFFPQLYPRNTIEDWIIAFHCCFQGQQKLHYVVLRLQFPNLLAWWCASEEFPQYFCSRNAVLKGVFSRVLEVHFLLNQQASCWWWDWQQAHLCLNKMGKVEKHKFWPSQNTHFGFFSSIRILYLQCFFFLSPQSLQSLAAHGTL